MVRRKREMSGFDLLCLEQEFQALVDGNFDKAYQPSRDEVLLRLRAPEEGRFDLAIGLGDYITRTWRSRDNPTHPPEFSKRLRQNLSGGKILSVRQKGFDRILVLEIGKHDGVYELIIESFHNGNVVLVQDDEIVVPLIHTEWSTREVRPGREWRYPPEGLDPREVSEPQLMEELRASDSDVIRTLATVGNLGPLYAKEVAMRASLDPSTAIEDLSASELARLVEEIRGLFDEITNHRNPQLVRDEEGEPVQASPVPLRVFEELDNEPVESLSHALDELFGPHAQEEKAVHDPRLDKLEALTARLERQVEDIQERIQGFEEQEQASRELGDLLYAHFQDVQTVLEEASSLHAQEGWGPLFEHEIASGQVTMSRPVPEHARIELSLPDPEGHLRTVEVELKKSVGKNAEVLYERSKEMRDKQEGARKALAHAEKELAEAEARGVEVVEELEAKQAAPDPTHRFWFDKYRWFIASTGHLVVGGRDARSNERLVKKHLEDNDRYLHANASGAPSVIVKAKAGEEIPEAALEEAAQLAVAYSKAWSSQLGRSEAYWVTPPQVSKTPEAGEYLPTGSFMIRGERNYLRSPVQAAIGTTTWDGHHKIMGGAVRALEERSDQYVVLEPGRSDPGELAGILYEVFDVPVEEVLHHLPPGPMRVVRSKGIDESIFAEVDR